jgi:hypothetical protein
MKTTKERLELWLSKFEQIVPEDAFKIVDLKDENGQATGTKVELLITQNLSDDF